MNFKWDKKRVKEICTVTNGRAYKQAELLNSGKYPVIRVGNFFTNNEIKYSNLELPKDKYCDNGDLLYCWSANFGPVIWNGEKSIYHYHIWRLSDFKGVEKKFLYYFLLNHTEYLKRYTHGTVMLHLTKRFFESIEVPLPLLIEQKKIAKILGDLDKKIELNNQINETLEAMAEALFKSWFIDFDPVHAKAEVIAAGGSEAEANRAAMSVISGKNEAELTQMEQEAPQDFAELAATAQLFPSQFVESELGAIPEGWEVVELQEVIDFRNGYGFKSKELERYYPKNDTYKVFKMGNIQKGGGYQSLENSDGYTTTDQVFLDKFLLKKWDLLMCMTDMKNNVALLGHTALLPKNNEYLVNQRVGRIRVINRKICAPPFLYFLTNDTCYLDRLRSNANSGVQVNLTTKAIKSSDFILPAKEIHSVFHSLVESWLEFTFILQEQNQTLAELRDTLLPKLLSGEIEVA